MSNSAAKTKGKPSGALAVLTSKIRTKLVVLFLAFGLSPAILALGILQFESGVIKADMRSGLATLADRLTDSIDRALFQAYRDVQIFALNDNAADPVNWQNATPDNPLLENMNELIASYDFYRLMLLVDANGRVLAVNNVDAENKPLATQGLYSESFADAPWLKKILAGDFLKGQNGLTGSVIEQPEQSRVVGDIFGDDGFTMVVAAPVKDDAGNTVAVWVNFVDFDLIEDIVADYYTDIADNGMPEGEVTLLDPEGEVLVDYDPVGQGWTEYKRNFEIIGKDNLVNKGAAAAIAAVTDGETGATDSIDDVSGEEEAAGYSKATGVEDFPGMSWSALIRVPAIQAYAAWDQVINFMLRLCLYFWTEF